MLRNPIFLYFFGGGGGMGGPVPLSLRPDPRMTKHIGKYRGSYMNAHVLPVLNMSNETCPLLRKINLILVRISFLL